MQPEPNGKAFLNGVIAWLLRIVLAAILAGFGAGGICKATELFRWQSSDYVCGHNAGLTMAPLFIVFWALLEFALPALLRGKR